MGKRLFLAGGGHVHLAVHTDYARRPLQGNHFAELRKHYSDQQIAELFGVVAINGFLSRHSEALAVVTDQESPDWAGEAFGHWVDGRASLIARAKRRGPNFHICLKAIDERVRQT